MKSDNDFFEGTHGDFVGDPSWRVLYGAVEDRESKSSSGLSMINFGISGRMHKEVRDLWGYGQNRVNDRDQVEDYA